MEQTLGFPSDVSVETIPTGPSWCVIVTMTISDPFPAGLEFDLASIYEPFVTLKNGQDPSVKILLRPFHGRNWRNSCTIQINFNQPLSKLRVAFWSHFAGGLNDQFEVDIWGVLLGLTPTRQLQAAKYKIPTSTNYSEARIDTCRYVLASGERWHETHDSTPIDEEPMDTWFDESYHGEGILCLQTTNTSASESTILDVQLLPTTHESPEHRKASLAASAPPEYKTISQRTILSPQPRRIQKLVSTTQ